MVARVLTMHEYDQGTHSVMSDREPLKAYVYQPEPVNPRLPMTEQRLWAIAGPDVSEVVRARRFTKAEAQRVLLSILVP